MDRQAWINAAAAGAVVLLTGGSSLSTTGTAEQILADVRAIREQVASTATTVAVLENRVTRLESDHGSEQRP